MFEKIKSYLIKIVIGGLPPSEVARQCYEDFQKEYEKMVDDKRFEVFTELLHTGIGITDYGKELMGQDVVDLMNEQIDDKAKLECQLRKRTRQRNQLADLNVKLMEENKLLARDNLKLKQENKDLIRLIDDLGHEEMNRQMEEILE